MEKSADVGRITEAIAKKVLKTVDAGLTSGMGVPEPGKMCVEAAVAYAMGEDHNDQPKCVATWLANEKISMNDHYWDSDDDRAAGLRRVAIAQLGSAEKLGKAASYKKFQKLLGEAFYQWQKKHVAEHNAKIFPKDTLKRIKVVGQKAGKAKTRDDIKNIQLQIDGLAHDLEYAAGNMLETQSKAVPVSGSWTATKIMEDDCGVASSEALHIVAEMMVQVLKKMKSPGCKYLYLTEKKKPKKR